MLKKWIFLCLLIILTPAWAMGEFLDNADKTITDTATGLMWQKETHGTSLDWEGAMLSCEARVFPDAEIYADWRLPSRSELLSIVTYGQSPAIDGKFAVGTGDNLYYWTSTTYVKDAKMAWAVNFKTGVIEAKAKTEQLYVRAVRGGQNEAAGLIAISEPQQTSDWQIGRVMPIIWTIGTTKATVPVKILVSADGGKTFDKTVVESTPNDGSYVWWKVGTADNGTAMNLSESENYVLKVEPTDGSAGANFQGVFSIGPDEGAAAPGDFDGDGQINLKDIIHGLKNLVAP